MKLCALAVLFIIVSSACSRGGERHANILSAVTCAECTIVTSVVWESRDQDQSILGTAWPLEMADELILMGEHFGPAIARLPLNGARGELMERIGDGPGEYRWISAGQIHPSGDTIVVIQDTRVSYLDTNLNEQRSFPNPVSRFSGVLLLSDGRFVFVSPRPPSSLRADGYVAHVVDAGGNLTGSFVPRGTATGGGLWPMSMGAEQGTIWIVEPQDDGFVAELWQTDSLTRVHRLAVRPTWWHGETRRPEEYERMAGRKKRVPRLPTGTVGVRESDGIIWVALRHYDVNHENGLLEDNQVHKRFDGVLLAVDPQSGDILASAVFDEFLLGFTNRGRLVLYDESEQGTPRVRLADVSFALRRK